MVAPGVAALALLVACAVAAYHARDGRQLWRSEADGEVFGLAVANGRLYASTSQGVIHCFEAKRLAN